MTRPRLPLPPLFDYVRPHERVPAPPHERQIEIAVVLAVALFGFVLWALPWISTWSIFQ